MAMRTRGAVLLASVMAVTTFGCGSSASQASDSTLRVVEKDFRVTADHVEVSAGKVRIRVRNDGAEVHELVAFRTDLDEIALPRTTAGNRINEEGPGITHLDPEAEDIAPGHAKTITIDLAPGRYVFVCNLPDHYGKGMHTVVTAT